MSETVKKVGRPKKENKVEPKKSVPAKRTLKEKTKTDVKPQTEKKQVNKKVSAPKKSVAPKQIQEEKIKSNTKPQTEEKPNTRVLTVDKKQQLLEKKYNRLVFILLVSILAIMFLIFLANKTFFRTEYVNKNLKLEIPIFTYFISDKDNVVTFKTLRKSENVKKYFDEYLSNLDNFDYYVCRNGKAFYYNDENNIVIYNIEVKKNIAIKTIKVKYDIKPSVKVCD